MVFNLSTIATSIVLILFLHKQFSLKRPLRAARRDTKETLNFSLLVYVSDVIRTFGGNIQTVLLAIFNTVTQVGIFVVASRVNLISIMFQRSIVTASMPIISELFEKGEREQMGLLYQAATKWLLTLNLPLFLVIWLFPEQILSIFGQSFVGGVAALTILACRSLVNAGTGICGVIIDMTGNSNLKLINTIVTVVFTLGLNILLIPRWGLVGAATAALTATILINSLRLLEVYILFRLLPYNIGFIKPATAAVIALGVFLVTNQLFPAETNIVYIVANVIVLFAVYVATILLLGLSPEDQVVLIRLRQRMSTTLLKKKLK
jgi:O-antigen/teichoic acid export membrane protein